MLPLAIRVMDSLDESDLLLSRDVLCSHEYLYVYEVDADSVIEVSVIGVLLPSRRRFLLGV